jgi:hypothetical protein
MTTSSPGLFVPKAARTERLNAHDLLGIMEHEAPEDEYDSKMRNFADRYMPVD